MGELICLNEFGRWSLSTAYDITFSNGLVAITQWISLEKASHIFKVAESVVVSPGFVKDFPEMVREVVSNWPKYASSLGVLNDTGMRQHPIRQKQKEQSHIHVYAPSSRKSATEGSSSAPSSTTLWM